MIQSLLLGSYLLKELWRPILSTFVQWWVDRIRDPGSKPGRSIPLIRDEAFPSNRAAKGAAGAILPWLLLAG